MPSLDTICREGSTLLLQLEKGYACLRYNLQRVIFARAMAGRESRRLHLHDVEGCKTREST